MTHQGLILRNSAVAGAPTVCLLSTGGTIAGLSTSTTTASNVPVYQSAQLKGVDLIGATSGLSEEFNWKFESPYQIGSQNLQWHHMLRMHELLTRLLMDDSVDAIVVTHGTDCLEDMLFFLHLCLQPALVLKKPLLFVAAMLPADHPQSDGPANLRNAMLGVSALLAAKKVFFGAVLNGLFTPAAQVRKQHTSSVTAFDSEYGLGLSALVSGLSSTKSPDLPAGIFSNALSGSLNGRGLENTEKALLLQSVQLLYCAPGFEAPSVAEGLPNDVEGQNSAFVIAAPGYGSIPDTWSSFLAHALKRGCLLVRASRVGFGGVHHGGEYQAPAGCERNLNDVPIDLGTAERVVDDWAGLWNANELSIPQCLVFARLALFETNLPTA